MTPRHDHGDRAVQSMFVVAQLLRGQMLSVFQRWGAAHIFKSSHGRCENHRWCARRLLQPTHNQDVVQASLGWLHFTQAKGDAITSDGSLECFFDAASAGASSRGHSPRHFLDQPNCRSVPTTPPAGRFFKPTPEVLRNPFRARGGVSSSKTNQPFVRETT